MLHIGNIKQAQFLLLGVYIVREKMTIKSVIVNEFNSPRPKLNTTSKDSQFKAC